ncbi:unnamed protein product [Adineta ricciae]|uniref:MACPF-like domain-containing protein n=1 Tax=Adineta ricciae TaxID=249248 RepID=A0A814DRU7_ADIRI|nr:unnamed protein product [Adineta ricciae]
MTTTNTPPDHSSQNGIEVRIELDGKKRTIFKDIPENQSLSLLRQRIENGKILTKKAIFLDKDGYEINFAAEDKWRIEDIMLENNVIQMKTQSEEEEGSCPAVPNISDNSLASIQRRTISTAEHRPAVIPGERTNNSSIDPCDATKFDLSKWNAIFERCNLFNGISFDDADLKPNASRARVCQFEEDKNLPEKIHVHRTITDSSKTEAHVAADEIRNTMIRNHCLKVDTTFQCPFVALASKYNQETQKTNDKQKKTLYTTCSWTYPRVTIYLFDDEASLGENYLKPTNNFEIDIEQFFENQLQDKLSIKNKYQTLKKIFQKYGYVYPKSVIIGGKLFHTDIQEVNKNVDEHEHKTKIHGAFNANFTVIMKNKVGFDGAYQTSGLQTSDNTTQKSSITWEATGGNTLQNNNAAAWQASVSSSQHWRVIEYGEFIPTYKLLNEKLQKQIERILYIYKMNIKRWKQNGETIAEKYLDILKLCKPILPTYYGTPIRARLIEYYTAGYISMEGKRKVAVNGYEYDWAFSNVRAIIHMIVDKENNSVIIADYEKTRVIRLFNKNEEILVENINCCGLTKDKYGFLYVSDIEKHEVRRWKIGEEKGKSGELVAGGNGIGPNLNQFDYPGRIFVDDDQSVYVSDRANHRVMKWKRDAKEGIIVAGGNGRGFGLNQLDHPAALIVDDCGFIFVVDQGNNRIVRWYEGETEGEIFVRGGDQSNRLYYPTDLSFDVRGNLYVVDYFTDRIRRFDLISGDNLYP